MKSLGTYLMIFGIGTFVLNAMGMEFKIMRIFGESQALAAGVMTALGGALFIFGQKQESAS